MVQDKAVAVRKNALALLSCVLDNNPFAGRCVCGRGRVGVWACGRVGVVVRVSSQNFLPPVYTQHVNALSLDRPYTPHDASS